MIVVSVHGWEKIEVAFRNLTKVSKQKWFDRIIERIQRSGKVAEYCIINKYCGRILVKMYVGYNVA